MASVFVRNLPYGVTQEELELVFGDVGPVRKIDLIKDKGKRKSDTLTRGFAFVKFAVASDAQLAIEQLNGTPFQGRKMYIDLAKDKRSRHEQQQHGGEQKQTQQQQVEAAEEAPAAKAQQEHVEDPVKKEKKEEKEKKEKKTKEVKAEEVKAETEGPKKEKKEVKKEKKAKADKKAPSHAKSSATAPATKQSAQQQQQQQEEEEEEHVQSERNARRRQHREFLRQVEARKDANATAAQKSVVIFGLGADVTKKHVLKKTKKIGPVASIELRADDAKVNAPVANRQVAVVRFEKVKDALAAVQKLDHHIFKGATLRVQSLEKHETTTGGERAGNVANTSKVEGLRLIVRNLAFQTGDEDLASAFAVYGPLAEARVVRMPVEKTEDEEDDGSKTLGKSRGFGFVQFRDVNDARAAVEALTGAKLKGREMIVDFALSKSKYLEQQNKQQEAVSQEGRGENDGDDEEVDEGDADDGEEAGDELEMATDDDDSDDESDDDEVEAATPVTYREDTEAQRDRTVFIRNLSFQTSEEALRDFFATFGPVEYARVVIDKGSGLSKGVGFVRFRQRDTADQVLARAAASAANAAALENKKGKDKKKHKKPENVFALSALADGDESLTLDGRLLSVTRAVSKTEAEHLAEANAAQRKAQDKRNLYLAYEGTINVNKLSDEQLEMPQGDISKRQRALREKKEKLKHPLYFVSPVRLSMRNLAGSVDDKGLKALARDAALAGMRAGKVVRAEVKRGLLPASDSVPVKVKMAKVVREEASAGSSRASGKSRGYGFVEFTEHVHALAALRMLNNNPKYTSLAAGKPAGPGAADREKPRLIVEFALEHHGKLKLREKRRQDAEKKREEERALREAGGADEADEEKKEKKSRGQRQRARKKERESAKAEASEEAGKPTKAKAKAVVTSKPVTQKKRKRDSDSADIDDAALDRAVGGAAGKEKPAKTLSRKERKRSHVAEKEQERSFDELVRSYKQDLFGESRKAKAKAAATGGDDSGTLERWFD